MVASGSKGMRPEIFLWSFDKKTRSLKLERKILLGRKANGVGKILPQKLSEKFLIFSDSVGMHQDCGINLFDL